MRRLLVLVLLGWSCAASAQTPPVAADLDWGSIREWFRFRKGPKPDEDVFRLVSWNLQTYGKRIKAERKRASAEALRRIFADAQSKVLAAQEIGDDAGAENVASALEGTRGSWTMDFENSRDAQDNGLFVRDGKVECSGFLFSTTEDQRVSRHPARAAHVRIGDLDFTLITVHLEYNHGGAGSSVAELRRVLDWVAARLDREPDVVVAGDFNLPTRAGKVLSQRGWDADWTPLEDVLAEYQALRMTPLVDEPTSRRNGIAANNYDHFLVTRHLLETAYVRGSAQRLPESFLTAIEAQERVEISDHFPIALTLRSRGAGVSLDGRRACPL